MSTEIYSVDGVLEERWDDGTRTYTDYRPDPDVSRPYTAEENAAADTAATEALYAANEIELMADLEQAIIDVQVLLDTPNSTIAATPAPYIKDLGHILKKVLRSVTKSFESTG